MGCVQCKRMRKRKKANISNNSREVNNGVYQMQELSKTEKDTDDNSEKLSNGPSQIIAQNLIPDTTPDSTFSIPQNNQNNTTNQIPHDISHNTQQDILQDIPQGFTTHEASQELESHTEEPTDVFSLLERTNITNANDYGYCEVVWTERHLQVEPGLNILATCKNVDCPCYLSGVICPRGLFQARKGYCSFDREIHSVTCPICKHRIAPDISFGIGFYRCEVELDFMLTDGIECQIPIEALYNTFVMTKCCNYSSGSFQYLEIRMHP